MLFACWFDMRMARGVLGNAGIESGEEKGGFGSCYFGILVLCVLAHG